MRALPPRTLREIADRLEGYPYGADAQLGAQVARLAEAVRRVLRPRPLSGQRRKTKARKATKREETARIRAVVFGRAGGRCEALLLSGERCACSASEMDHFPGRGKAPQTVENCWALCSTAHRYKTNNNPSAAWWLRRFFEHCTRHGYTEEGKRVQRRLAFVEARELLTVRSE